MMSDSMKLSVLEAAKKLAVAPATVYAMIRREDLPAEQENGRVTIDERDLAGVTKRTRGRSLANADRLLGKRYAYWTDEQKLTMEEVAHKFSVSKQAVSKAIARYREAAVREG